MRLFEARSLILSLPQSARFILAGGTAALINWLVRFPLSYIMPFAGAVAAAHVIGMMFGFVTYRMFVFPGSTHVLRRQLAGFITVNLVGMVVVVAVSVLFAGYIFPLIGFHWETEAIAHAVGIGAGAISNFFGHRHVSFARR